MLYEWTSSELRRTLGKPLPVGPPSLKRHSEREASDTRTRRFRFGPANRDRFGGLLAGWAGINAFRFRLPDRVATCGACTLPR